MFQNRLMHRIVDKDTGKIIISRDLVIEKGYSFDEFKQTSYYTNQDAQMAFGLGQSFVIGSMEYGVTLVFDEEIISQIHLWYAGEDMPPYPSDEIARAKYVQILELDGYDVWNQFEWGGIAYEYDPRMSDGSLIIWYNN